MGRYLEIDPAIVRVLAVILFFASWGTVLVAYIVAWIIIPREDYVPPEAAHPNAQASPSAPRPMPPMSPSASAGWRGLVPGIILVILGLLIILRDHYFWFSFGDIWPLLLIVAGAGLIVFRGLGRSTSAGDEPEPSVGNGNNGGIHNGHNGGTVS